MELSKRKKEFADVLGSTYSVGRNIKLARESRALSISKLSKLANVSRGSIRKIESGEPGVSIGILARVLKAMYLDKTLDCVAGRDLDEVGRFLFQRSHPEIPDEENPAYNF